MHSAGGAVGGHADEQCPHMTTESAPHAHMAHSHAPAAPTPCSQHAHTPHSHAPAMPPHHACTTLPCSCCTHDPVTCTVQYWHSSVCSNQPQSEIPEKEYRVWNRGPRQSHSGRDGRKEPKEHWRDNSAIS